MFHVRGSKLLSMKTTETTQPPRPTTDLFDGLLWYLETRNWAFAKMKACPMGTYSLDIKMYHYLYFVNLFGGVDLVGDYLKPLGEEAAFHDAVKRGFAGADYDYARQLRNSVVHRGLDPAGSAHVDGAVVRVLCPAKVYDQGGNNSYICTFRYTVELADHCNQAVNPAIFEVLERHGFLDPAQIIVSKKEAMEEIRNSEATPDWAKAMAQKLIYEVDFDDVASKIAATRIKQIKTLLGGLEEANI
jgi:hypothetical protein